MSPFREPGEIAVEIPPVRRLQARVVLATVIVAPVRLITWTVCTCRYVLAANAMVGIGLGAVWLTVPGSWVWLVAANVVAGIGYGAYRAYCWAKAVLAAESEGDPEAGR